MAKVLGSAEHLLIIAAKGCFGPRKQRAAACGMLGEDDRAGKLLATRSRAAGDVRAGS
jgi:hypothetical protein